MKKSFTNKYGKKIEGDIMLTDKPAPSEVPVMWWDIKKNSNWDFKYITWADTKKFSKLLAWEKWDKWEWFLLQEKIDTINKIMNYNWEAGNINTVKDKIHNLLWKDITDENKIKIFNDNKDVRKECYWMLDEIEKYKFIIETINYKRDNKWLNEILRKKLKLKSDEIYLWWFWDKSWFWLIYSNNKLKVSNKINKNWYWKIIEDLAFIDYSFSAWFKNNALVKNQIDDLLKPAYWSYEEFRNKILELEIPLALQQWKLPVYDWDKIVYPKNKADEWWLAQAIANIRKREASYTSTHSIFDSVEWDVDLYVVKEILDETQEWYKELQEFNNIKNELSKLREEKWYETNPEYLSIRDQYENKLSIDQERYWVDEEYTRVINDAWYNPDSLDNRWALLNYYDALNSKYLTDLEDGTSHASQDLWDQLAIINWKDKLDEVKTHIAWNSNWENFLWKNLINFWDLKSGDEVLKDTVLVWESSAKLNWWYKPLKKTKIIERYNPETKQYDKYEAIWKVEWANKSWFKNAAEEWDAYDDITLNDSVIIKYDSDKQDAFKAVQADELQNLFQTFKQTLTEKEIWQLWYWDLNAFIQNIVSWTWIWKFSDEVIQSKVWTFLSEASNIINKNRWEWQSFYHYKCSHRVTPNEIWVNKNSRLFNQLENNQKKVIKDLRINIEELKANNMDTKKADNELIEAERVLMDSDYQVVAIRYPVSNKYNPWTFQVRTFNDISEHSIVTNPETAYLKLESDSDWDHIFVSWIHDKYTNIIARWLEWQPFSKEQIELTSKFDQFFNWEIIKPWSHSDLVSSIISWPSKFIMVEQVEKWKLKEASKVSIVESRNAALEAKYNIWIVQATIRTFNILRYHAEKILTITDDLKLSRYIDTLNPEVRKLLDINYKKVDKDKIREFAERFDDDFHKDSASITQVTIDFGNSGKDKFDKNWYNPLVEKIFKTTNPKKKAEIINRISAISTTYSTKALWSISQANSTSALKDSLERLSWNKKELYNYFESLYRPVHNSLMFSSSEKFLLNKLFEVTPDAKKIVTEKLKDTLINETKYGKHLYNSFSKGDSYIDDLIYLSKWQKEYIQWIILKDKVVMDAVLTRWWIDKIIKSGDIKDEQRYKLALYMKTLDKWQAKEFKRLHWDRMLGMTDFLNDKDLVEYIKYAEEKRSRRVMESKILEWTKDTEIEEIYKQALEHRKNFEPAYNEEVKVLDNEIELLEDEIKRKLDVAKKPELAADKNAEDLFDILQRNIVMEEPEGMYSSFLNQKWAKR